MGLALGSTDWKYQMHLILGGLHRHTCELADLDVAKRAVADVLGKLFSLPAGVTGNLSWNLSEYQLGQQPKHTSWQAAIAALKTDADPVLPQG
jgi:hypothetical protein